MGAGAAFLLLGDGRAPAGTSSHSFGLELATAAGDVVDLPSLVAFVGATLHTAGAVDAGFAAAVCARTRGVHDAAGALPDVVGTLRDADAEYGARVPAPAVASRSRDLGRYLLRLGIAAWPSPALDDAAARRPGGWHQPVVLGLVAAGAGLHAGEAATCALHGLSASIASAGIRLLGLDPLAVHAAQARLASVCDELAAAAAHACAAPFAALPAWSAPLAEIRAEGHAVAPALFAS